MTSDRKNVVISQEKCQKVQSLRKDRLSGDYIRRSDHDRPEFPAQDAVSADRSARLMQLRRWNK